MEATLSKNAAHEATSSLERQADDHKAQPVEISAEDAMPGAELIRRMREKLIELGGDAEEQMLACLGIQRTYWNAFCNGHRSPASLIGHKGRRDWIAEFLDVPAITIRIWADDVTLDELNYPGQDALWLDIRRARQDARFNALTPRTKAEWDALPLNIKLLVISLYRTVTDRDVVEQRKTMRRKPTVEPL